MPVTKLRFTNIGPFQEIEFEFDPQVNVFTGPNNSGKSSALWVLGDILVYPFDLPEKLMRPGLISTFGIHKSRGKHSTFHGELPILVRTRNSRDGVNEQYWTNDRWRKGVEFLSEIGYSKFIPALRRSSDFRSSGPTVTNQNNSGDKDPQDTELDRRLSLVSNDPSLISDEAVIQIIVDLDYRSYLKRKPEWRAIISLIGEIVSEITEGFPIGFSGVSEDADGFYPEFDTLDGTLPLNALSQGTQSIIQWIAHLLIGFAEYHQFPDDLRDRPGILIVDEIDAHLHPSWQRRIIPALTKHFPNLQIFCSTHSPLMLAGLKEGQVQLLMRDSEGNITVSRNEVDIVGWSSDEILRNFLGVFDPTDLDSSARLSRLQELRQRNTLLAGEAEELESLRHMVRRDLERGPVPPPEEGTGQESKAPITETAESTDPPSSSMGRPRRRSNPRP